MYVHFDIPFLCKLFQHITHYLLNLGKVNERRSSWPSAASLKLFMFTSP